MTWLLVLLITLTTYRITRLLTQDALPLVARPRAWIIRRTGEHSAWAYLVECPWCTGVYVAAAVTAATDVWVSVPYPFLVAGAAAALTGIIAELLAALEPEE